MHNLVLFLLGELPVQRTQAFFRFRNNIQNLASCPFGKRCCLHCLLHRNVYVLDSEWHWIFDCPHFSAQRAKFPMLSRSLVQVMTEDDGSSSPFSKVRHVGDLMNVIRLDFSVGTSFASFLALMKRTREDWLVTVGCARGRLCEAPVGWSRDLFVTPPSAAECSPDYMLDFVDGKPLPFRFDEHGDVLFTP